MPRLNFTKETQRQALTRSKGICECHLIPHVFPNPCGRPIGPGNIFYEHIICDELRKDNALENCAVLTKTCWKIKTDTYDKPVIAKAHRNFDSNNGIRDPWAKRLPGGRQSDVKIKLNGLVIDRRTGAPAWPR